MRPGWNAAATRGRLLLSRRLGPDRSRELSRAGWPEGRDLLAASGYGHYLPTGASPRQAGFAVRHTCLWNLRVLAGWAPPRGADVIRAVVALLEIEAALDHLAALSVTQPPARSATGSAAQPATRPGAAEPLSADWYEPGQLSTAWRAISSAPDPEAFRSALTGSVWRDPGAVDAASVTTTMGARWAVWVAESVPGGHGWAQGYAALVAARALAGGRRWADLPDGARSDLEVLLGRRLGEADTWRALPELLPADSRWLLAGITSTDQLWLAEGRWWARLQEDSAHALTTSRDGAAITGAAAALLMEDAWRVEAALEAAQWGPAGAEVFDAVA